MSIGSLVYLGAMAIMFIAQRLVGGQELQTGLTVVALGGLLVAAGMRFRELGASKDAGIKQGHRVALMFLLVGVASLVFYAATTEWAVQRLSMGAEAEGRWLGVWKSLWPILWLLGTIPMLIVDHAIESSPVMMPRQRVRDLTAYGVVTALIISLVFPVNYIASQRNERWDLAYFKTPVPGSATFAIAQSLEAPVHVRIFMPPSSEVAQELRAYFAELEGPNLSFEILDQASAPGVAQKLAVRDNGTIAFTVGDIDAEEPDTKDAKGDTKDTKDGEEEAESAKPKLITRTLRINADFDKAKRTLKKLDQEVQKRLIELGDSERVVYMTQGHGELTWQGKTFVDRQNKFVRDRLKELGFNIKPLGPREGLANEIPEDADAVFVLGPRGSFQQPEAEALQRYIDQGGSVLIAMEPLILREAAQSSERDPLEELIEGLGVKFGDGILAAEQGIYPLTNEKIDRLNLFTNSFTSHPSNRTLAEEAGKAALLSIAAGHLEEMEDHPNNVTFTARSLAVAWADLNKNGDFEADQGESKAARNLVAAITGGREDTEFRAIVTADGTMFSDLGMGSKGNRTMLVDAANWMVGAEALSGTTESEEDVKIEHSKEGQVLWFYLTVLGVPLGVFALGALRLRLRTAGAIRRAAKRGGGGQ